MLVSMYLLEEIISIDKVFNLVFNTKIAIINGATTCANIIAHA